MKKGPMKKVLSTALAAAMVLNMGWITGLAGTEPAEGTGVLAEDTYVEPFQKDDFSDAAYSSGLWETVQVADGSTLTQDFGVADGVMMPPKSATAKMAYVTVPADACWTTAKLLKLEMKLKVDEFGGYDANPALYLYYDEATRGYCYLQFQKASNGKLLIRMTAGNGFTVKRQNIMTSADSSTIPADGWLTLQVEYRYDKAFGGVKGMEFGISVLDADGNQVLKAAEENNGPMVILNGAEDFASGFKFGIGTTTLNTLTGGCVDDVTIATSFTAEDWAGEFEKKHAALLALTPDTYDPAVHGALFDAAIEEFLSLSADIVAALRATGTESKLIALAELGYAEEKEAFRSRHEEILGKRTGEITPDDASALAAAFADYEAADAMLKMVLSVEKSHLDDLQKALDDYVPPREDGDYSDFTEDFENGIIQWEPQLDEGGATVFETVQDPDDPDNHILKIQGKDVIYTVKDALWPSTGRMTQVTFRMRLEMPEGSTNPVNANTPPRVFYSFVDENNFDSFILGNNRNTATRSMVDGVGSNSSWTNNMDVNALACEWINVTITYNGKNATIQFSDDKENLTVISGRCSLAGRLALGVLQSWNAASNPFYIDDIRVQFEEGDWDVNDKIEEIYAYYSGNAYVRPGEIAMISGEKLFNTVESLEIMRLDDKTDDGYGYIRELYFDKVNDYTAAIPASQATWDAAEAKPLEIIQTTRDSFKFIIPEEYEEGIYAVRLNSKISSDMDVILYLNNPETSFAMGDEGDIATKDGWLRVIGNNMVPGGNADDVLVKLVNLSTKAEYTYQNTAEDKDVITIHDGDMYSLEVNMSKADIPEGEYEVFAYNGYGDATAWSAPVKITVGPSPRDLWPQDVFNVKDFGATGDAHTNDGPAITNALAAAEANGGGIVYLPAGVYRVINTLVIPENVSLRGDGKNDSSILWTASKWAYGELPDTLIGFTRNVEICDLGLHGTRFRNVLTTYTEDKSNRWNEEENQNIYVHDVIIQMYTRAGTATGGGGTGGTGQLTVGEIVLEIMNEMSEAATYDIDGKNVQMDNVYFDTDRVTDGIRNLRMFCSYVRIANSRWVGGWTWANMKYATIFENNDVGESSAVNLSGHGTYMARNYLHDSRGNNRELFTTDGNPMEMNRTIQFVGDQPEYNDEVSYKFLDKSFTKNQLVGYTIMIVSGQGFGQLRTVVENEGSYVKLDQPFAVKANRNCLVNVQEPRQDWVFVDNVFENGGASGTYGTMLDAVWDGNIFKRHGGQIFNNHNSPVWYVSVLNEVLEDPLYIHGEGAGGTAGSQTGIGHMQLLFALGNFSYSTLGFTYRNNTMKDGSYLRITWTGQASNSVRDLILENNTVERADVGILSSSQNYTTMDGMILRGNDLSGAGREYQEGSNIDKVASGQDTNNINNADDKRIILYEEEIDPEEPVLRGDVNGDGVINLKDSTLLRNHLIGNTTLTAEQLERADVNYDGKADLKDVNFIRRAVLGDFTIEQK